MLIPDSFDGLNCPKFLHDPRALPRRPRSDPANTFGAARLADTRDVDRWFEQAIHLPHSTHFSHVSPMLEGPRGLEVQWNRTLTLPERERNRHMLVVSQPGGGKTQNFILPVLYADIADTQRSLVVLDPKGELLPFVQAAAARLRPGQKVQVLNLTDRSASVGWNPLARLQIECARRRTDLSSALHELASTLAWASEVRRDSRDSIFFINASIQLIAGLCEGLLQGLGRKASLGHVFELLQGSRQLLRNFTQRYQHTPGLTTFTSFLASGSQNAETVLADAQVRLACWRDQTVCAVTGQDELDLQSLIEEPGILVIRMREAELDRLRPVINLLFTTLLQQLMREASEREGAELPRPVSLVIDEFASAVGRIPGFETSVNTLRGPRVSIVAAVQSLAQIRYIYDDAHESVLAGFNTKIFQPGLESIDAEYASLKAGVMSALTLHQTEPNPAQPLAEEHRELLGRLRHRHKSSAARRLFHPEEIARPPRHFDRGQPATVFLPDTNPFQAWFLPAWRHPSLGLLIREGQAQFRRAADRAVPLDWNTRKANEALELLLRELLILKPPVPKPESAPPPPAKPPAKPRMRRKQPPTRPDSEPEGPALEGPETEDFPF
jgi:hypothetical protein